jgi:hypothetical protein
MNIYRLNIPVNKKTILWFTAILFILTIMLRMNVLLEPLGTDQGIFSYVGMCLNRGDVLYTDVQDHKPPLIFYLYKAFTGIHLPIKATLFIFDTFYLILFALLIGWFMERYILKKSFFPSALLFLFLICTKSLYEGGNQSEDYMIFFQFLFYIGLWRYLKEGICRPLELFLSGSMLAVAGLWKPVALIAIVPAGLMLLTHLIKTAPRERKIMPFLYLIAGFCLPHIVLVCYFSYLHNLREYVYASYLFDIVLKQRYPSETNSFFMNLLIFIKEQILALAFIWVAFLLLMLEQIKGSGIFKRQASTIGFWGMLCVFDVIAACSGGRFFGHYFIQPLVSTTVLLTVIFSVFSEKRKAYMQIIGILLMIALTFQLLKVSTAHLRKPVDVKKVVGEYIKARTTPQDTVYVNGVKTGVNFFAERKAPWKYVHDIFIRISDKNTMATECRRMLNKRPKFIVITNPDWVFLPVQQALDTRYQKVKTLYNYDIFRLQ